MRKLLAVLGAAVLLLAAGCGSGGRPSADELSKAIRHQASTGTDAIVKESVTKRAADCMGQVLSRSGLSDEALQALVDGKKHYDAGRADKQVMKRVAPQFVNCIPEMRQLKDQLGQLTGTPQP